MGEIGKDMEVYRRPTFTSAEYDDHAAVRAAEELMQSCFAQICESSAVPVEMADQPWVDDRLQNTARRMNRLDLEEKHKRPVAEA